MSAPVPAKSKDDFHRERSRFLDAFATLEEALTECPLSSAETNAAALLKALRCIRNDLVHSQLRFANIDGELQAIAINAQQVRKPARQSRIFAIGDFQKLRSQIGHVKKALADQNQSSVVAK